MDTAAEFLSAIVNTFEANKRLADRAVGQVPDDKLHVPLDPNTNSVAVIMRHIAGNLASRWTDFLTADGEKPWRDRDAEFVDAPAGRADLLDLWERGWACLFTALAGLTPEDLTRTVTIRGEPHTVPLALSRSLGHACYHVGQIVQAARVHAGEKWDTLTIPRGGSGQFNRANWGRAGRSHPQAGSARRTTDGGEDDVAERRRGGPRAAPFDYTLDFKATDFRRRPDLYRVGKGEQGVLLVEPYKGEILPHWRFKTAAGAKKSSAKIYKMFLAYLRARDFPGADMARKFLQMGWTRARRYASHKSGRKYDKTTGEELPRGNDPEKAAAAAIFYERYVAAREHPDYVRQKGLHQQNYEAK